jgi:CRP-like cAMP-binding protein
MFGIKTKTATRGGPQTLPQLEALYASGKQLDAIEGLEVLVIERPQSTQLRVRLADWLVEVGRRDDAISALFKLQEQLNAQGDLLAAISAGVKIVKLDPKFENPLSYVAKVSTDRLRETAREEGQEDPTETEGNQQKLSQIPLLSELEPDELVSVARAMKSRILHPGAAVFNKGEQTRSLCFVVSGTLQIQSDGKILDTATAGQCLGEFAFLTGEPRSATLIARSKSEVLELSYESMESVVEAHPRVRSVLDRMYQGRVLARVLGESRLFGLLEAGERHRIASSLYPVVVPKGSTIVEAGSTDGCLFLLKSGCVEIRAPREEDSAGTEGTKLGRLGPNDFFGEVSFLTGLPRTANVIATEDSEVLCFDRDELEDLVAEHPKLRDILRDFHLDRAMNAAQTIKAATRA